MARMFRHYADWWPFGPGLTGWSFLRAVRAGCRSPRFHPGMCRCGPHPDTWERVERELAEGTRQVIHLRRSQ